MKTFTEWLKEAAGIATSRSQCVQGDEPNFAGACSDLPKGGLKGRKNKNRAPVVNEAVAVSGSIPANTQDYFTAGAPGKQEKMKPKKSKPKMD